MNMYTDLDPSSQRPLLLLTSLLHKQRKQSQLVGLHILVSIVQLNRAFLSMRSISTTVKMAAAPMALLATLLSQARKLPLMVERLIVTLWT